MSGVSYAVSSCYERLVAAIEDAAAAANAGTVRRLQSFVTCFQRENQHVKFNCSLIMENWKWRGAATRERVTIVVRASELMTRDASTITKSNVGVSYFKMKKSKLVLLHSVHYDFDGCQACHPVFHAQLTAKPVTLSDNDVAELRCTLPFNWARNSQCFKDARIPTSDMTFASVLLCLAADHIGGQFFVEFKEKVVTIQQSMPKPNFTDLRESIAAEPTRLGSSHWFAHDRSQGAV